MRTKLRNNEEVYLITRPHWFVLLRPILGVLFTGGMTYLMYALAAELNTTFYMWCCFALFFFTSMYTLYRWYERSVDIWAVTNYRVIEEEGVFSILAKESPLDKINNISYQQTFWGRIFGFGDVEIQTAAGEGMTIHRFINNPKELKDTINEAKDRFLIARSSGGHFSNKTSLHNKAISEAENALSSGGEGEKDIAEIVVNLYQKTDMEIAQIAAMVNKDKNFVIEVLMDRRMLDKR